MDLVLKPIPTVDVGSNPDSFDLDAVLTPAFWETLPGDVALTIKVKRVGFVTIPY
jgi:hypothetical protein